MQRKIRLSYAFHLLFSKKIIRLYLSKNFSLNICRFVKILIDFRDGYSIIQREFLYIKTSHTKMSIHKLPDYVINRLKAWEIVERPSSILKELVENSLDAWAQHIEITINDWWKSFLSVQDDWTGIELSDMDLLLERYATSKIQNDGDLYNISSYWFRGEALASISEVSKITVITKTKYSQIWTKLQKKWWDIITNHLAVWFEHWTIVEIEDLFFNIPARQKFLKSAQTEYFYCYSYFVNIALRHADKHLTLRKNNRIVFDLKPSNLLDRITDIYKQDWKNNLKEFDTKTDFIHFYWVVSDPRLRFWSAENIKIYVNWRPIQDKIIKKALMDAYSRQITPWEYPFAVLKLDIDPKIVDVNVHPSKLQVKFTDSQQIFQMVYNTISETLWQNKISHQSQHYNFNNPNQKFYYNQHNWVNKQSSAVLDHIVSDFWEIQQTNSPTSEQVKLFDEAIKTTNITNNSTQSLFWLDSLQNERNEWNRFFNEEIWEYKIIWQIWNSYIIIESQDALYYIDQHALAERIAFETMKKEENLNPEPLLQPLKYEITNVPNLPEKIEELNQLWFEISMLWENIIVIYATPQIFATNPVDLMTLFNHVLYLEKITFDHLIDWVYATRACKTSIKAWNKLSIPQMEALVKDWFEKIPWMFVCQHWRPFFVRIEKKEIDWFFDRK